MRRSKRWLAVVLLVCACRGSERSAPESVREPALQVEKSAPTVLSERLTRPARPRVIAIGDLHGDLGATRKVLRLAGLIDEADHWVAKDTTLVQTGDEIDRGDDDRAILDLFERLSREAKEAGGEVIALSGNHELMNVQQDFRYVTPGGFSAFPEGRGAAFRPGSRYARLFLERPMFVRVDKTLFVHGGILPKHVAYGLDRMQRETDAWLSGARAEPPSIVFAEDGPIWTRAYSQSPGPHDCAELGRVLDALASERMVVGHTVQSQGINPACGGRVVRIDVGLSRAYGGPVQALEIRAGALRVLREP